MSELDLETVKCEVKDYIAVVKLDNPPVNAHSAQMLADIPKMFDRLSDMDEVRAVVLTGEGKVFCAGADIKTRSGGKPQAGDHWQSSRNARECYHSIRECQRRRIHDRHPVYHHHPQRRRALLRNGG